MSNQIVGRTVELAHLNNYLKRSLAGEAQLCFVTGEAGAGKTTLLAKFAQQVEDSHANLLMLVGNCNGQAGISDPFLPFRHVLALLTGNPEVAQASGIINAKYRTRLQGVFKTSGRALVELAPELIGSLIPGASLLVSIGRLAAKEFGWLKTLEEQAKKVVVNAEPLDRDQIFVQYTALLGAVAKDYPLVIILDDLHWADTASIGLLFHLSRELRNDRILLIGTYRPNDIELEVNGRAHPLKATANEITRYRGNVCIDLDETTRIRGRAFVDALVNSEPNQLNEAFRAALHQRTNGNALFTVELLRTMQEGGDLIRDGEGHWQAAPTLDWNELPAQVEAVIAERIRRLTAEEQELLQIGAVEGQLFTVEVAARIQRRKERAVLQTLARDLQRRHHLVLESGALRVGKQTLTKFTFSHSLVQYYLYTETLGPGERRWLHRDVATALEELYVEDLDRIAPQLIHHYVAANEEDKALPYMVRAGERALNLGAPQEAKEFLSQASVLLEQGSPDLDLWLRTKLLLGLAHRVLSQFDDAKEAFTAALQRARVIDRKAQIAEALLELEYIADRQMEDHLRHLYLNEVLALARQRGDKRTESIALRRLARLNALTWYIEERLSNYQKALDLAREIADKKQQAEALNALAIVYANNGNSALAIQYYQQAIEIARSYGDYFILTKFLGNLAIRYRGLGQYQQAIKLLEEAIEILERVGSKNPLSWRLMTLGGIYRRMQQYELALQHLQRSLDLVHDSQDPELKAWINIGLALLFLDIDQLDLALEHVTIAEQQSRRQQDALCIKSIILARLGGTLEATRETLRSSIVECQETISRNPQNTASHYYLTISLTTLALLEKSGDEQTRLIEEAKAIAHQAYAISSDKGTVDYYMTLLNHLKPLDSDALLQGIREIWSAN